MDFSTFFLKRLIFPSVIGILVSVLFLALFVPFSEKLYDFIPLLTVFVLSAGSFVSSKICTQKIKHSRLLLSLFCSLTILLIIGVVSTFVFHSFSLSRFLSKSFFVISFGILGSIRKMRSKRQKVARKG